MHGVESGASYNIHLQHVQGDSRLVILDQEMVSIR
jgi:hypothetical protein